MKQLRRIPFTKEGLDKIKADYERVKASRPEAVETLRRARDLGDLSENGLYKAARAQLSSIDGRLTRLEILIKLADVQEAEKGVIGLGSRVKLKDVASGHRHGNSSSFKSAHPYEVPPSGTKEDKDSVVEYIIVGEYEADPINKKISTASPIGKALVGKQLGETIVVNLPTKNLTYKIVEIS